MYNVKKKLEKTKIVRNWRNYKFTNITGYSGYYSKKDSEESLKSKCLIRTCNKTSHIPIELKLIK